jgi:hypothetical protein
MSIVVVQRIIPVEAGEKADTLARVEGSSPASDTARRAGHHRGLRRAEHVVRGETRELGRAQCLLVKEAGRVGVPADQEPWRGQPASHYQRTAGRDTKGGSRQGIGARARREATREGHKAVVAEHSTGEGGEVRPQRPTGGKARPGRAWEWEARREGLRAYQPSEPQPGHRRGVAQLCASGRDELAGYPDRSSGPDTEEPDE